MVRTPLRPDLSSALFVAAIPAVLTLILFFAWTHKPPLGGDEPHYLIMAKSLLSDQDLELKNNYDEDAQTRAIYGPTRPHVFALPRGWMPYHGSGLSFLVALPFAAGGERAVRVFLCLFTGLLPWMWFRWLNPVVDHRVAGWAIVGSMLAPPVLFGSTQIYADLPAGVISTVLMCWLLIRTREKDATRTWPVFWLVTGLLPWLNPKYAVTTIVFALGGMCLTWRLRSDGRRAAARLAVWTLPLAAAGPLLLAGFNFYASGSVFGVRGAGELTTSPARALTMFAGLHLDQSQGMFFQQPLLLAGVAAFVPFARSRPRVALFWVFLYLSLIVPNSFQMARFGLGTMASRFAWSAMWLWFVPVGFALASYDVGRFVRPAVITAALYQLALSLRWVSSPGLLFTQVRGPRDSLFPLVLQPWLPSFYTWDFMSYLYSPFNQLAFLLLIFLLAAGAYLTAPTFRAPSSG